MADARESEEQVQLVDEDGAPTDQAPRSLVRRDNLRHGATAVLLRNPAGEVFVHRRSDAKDWAPGHHDAAAGGMLGAGEAPEASARRELAEELGVPESATLDLCSHGAHAFRDDTVDVVEHVYEAVWDGPVRFTDGEVSDGAWLDLPALVVLLRDPERPMVPDTRALLARLADAGVGDWGLLRSLEAAQRLALDVEVVRHGPVRSAQEAAEARGVPPEALAKTMVVRVAEGDHRLVVLPAPRQIDWRLLRAAVGVHRLTMAGEDEAYAVTGYRRGAITPLGVRRPLPVLVDEALLDHAAVSLGSGAPMAGLRLDPAALVTAVSATVAALSVP